MAQCFVMQPFDDGPFDRRYEQVYAPAIVDADLEPYRVDRDPAVSIPIEDIEEGIRRASVCFADITANNPNVWFELGYAIASGKDVVLVCSAERQARFPFDVQHRRIIQYRLDAPDDFQKLKVDITERLRSIEARQARVGNIGDMSHVLETEGLTPHEIACLIAIVESSDAPGDIVSASLVQDIMEKSGYTKVASMLAMRSLKVKKMIDFQQEHGGFDNTYYVCIALDLGLDWLDNNQDKIRMKVANQQTPPPAVAEDDLPF